MSRNVAADFISAVKNALKITKDEDLARHYGLGKSTIASWRARNSIPVSTIKKMENDTKISFEYFFRARSSNQPFFEWLVELTFLAAFSDACEKLEKSERHELILRTVWHANSMKELISERIHMEIGNQNIIDTYPDIIADAFRGKFLDAADISSSCHLPPPYPLPSGVPQTVPQAGDDTDGVSSDDFKKNS